jgi:proteasome activator subunit 4
MKCSRYIKLRTMGHTDVDSALEQNHNPLRRSVHIEKPDSTMTLDFLSAFKEELDADRAVTEPYV